MARARSTSNSLKRAKDGSPFTRCEECNRDVAVVLIDMHSCSQESKLRMKMGFIGYQWKKNNYNWMTALGLTPKKTESERRETPQRRPYDGPNGTSDEAKRIAAAALSAVKDAAAASAAVATMGRG